MDATPEQENPVIEEEQEQEQLPEPETVLDQEQHVRQIPGGAGHGPARVYGYIALARAMGAEAVLIQGGTRSTSRNPLLVQVNSSAEVFQNINSLYDEIAPVAEQFAAQQRASARKDGAGFSSSYAVNLLTRAVLSGFPQGAASVIAGPGQTAPLPVREATRARLLDESAHQVAVIAGREWAAERFSGEKQVHES